MKREVLVLRGRVQAVGFRYKVLQIAGRYRVAGTVRNCADETVEIDVEGENADVDAFLADVLAHPPRSARVDGATRETHTPRGARGFTAV